MSKEIEYDESESESDIEDEEGNDSLFITNNEDIKEKKFSWISLLMYLLIFAGAVLFIITASLDPRESTNLYITAGAILGAAFLIMLYINS